MTILFSKFFKYLKNILKESFAVAIEYHKNNNLKKAWELYHQLIDKNPNNYLVLGNIGLLSIQLDYIINKVKVQFDLNILIKVL